MIICFIATILSGCFTPKRSTHNSQHFQTIKSDLKLMIKDIDSFLGLNKPSSLTDY